jgi:hypothetical protein
MGCFGIGNLSITDPMLPVSRSASLRSFRRRGGRPRHLLLSAREAVFCAMYGEIATVFVPQAGKAGRSVDRQRPPGQFA